MQKKPNRIWDIAHEAYEKFLALLFILVVLVGIYVTLDIIYVYRNAEEKIKAFKPDAITEETLREISGDTVAWITLDDTPIDYPIMQSDNNIDYLNKDPKGNYSLAGSIFMDFRCNKDFTDPYSLVYGHHMSNHMMFGGLDLYKEKNFAKEHQTGTLYTLHNEYPIRVLAYYITKTNCMEIFNPDPSIDRIEHLRTAGNYYLKENETEHILALTTCKDPATTDRTALLVAIQMPNNGE